MPVEKDNFIAVIKDNQSLIFKICYSYCSNPEDRKDLQQDIIIQLWNSFTKFDGRVKISTWIYRIALNTAISFYRKDRKNKEKIVSMDTSLISLPVFGPNVEQDERITLLYKYIENLNEIDKALILLLLEDKSYREIADILGITLTNVATKISRVKKNLKKQFNNN
ncbi:MAG: sigma-70 family RNA polymerase sigma factor [Bacteroidales bacterium]|jgi:RNA polymerase sigma-70 factor (ECF subfamily)|nr:sigma-70 family RNA polymerase sigma factor [Bacteroidales bacterium]MDD3702505.1 sigma-70 family RNA polymerase sigma factor [Bacteroidales bacterium]MDY0369578.1 sigma-70 family RNA polymerase sigma factor [Bacteroidales bacterium]